LYLDKAIEAYINALKFDPKNKNIYKHRGDIYQYIGETEKADADFKQAFQIEYPNDRSLSGRILIGGDSIKTVKNSAIEYPEEFQIIRFTEVSGNIEGLAIMDENNDGKISDEEVRKPYTSQLLKLHKLVKFNPKSDLALWKRGDLFLEINELSNQLFWISAVSDFLNAFDINPRFEYLNNAGVVRAKRDNKTNYEFAVKYFTDAIQLNNQSYEVFYNRGLAYLKLNENDKSIADFTEVMKLRPNFVLAYKSRAKAYRKLGKTAEAEADERAAKRLEEKFDK
jgi:tetratricopeptide (TPR) repeat protein